MNDVADLRTRMARSITAGTGAMIGGFGVATPIVVAATAEIWWGRPSSTSGLAFVAAVILGAAGAAIGAALGHLTETSVRASPLSGPVEWRLAGVLLLVVAGSASVLLVSSGLRQEALNTPRVIFSTGEIVRRPGEIWRPTISSATLIWSLSSRTGTSGALRWNGERVNVSVRDDQLEASAGAIRIDAVSLSDFDYVREIYGVTATLATDRTEYLALLLDLRTSGRRSLLLVFDPRGSVVHKELMSRQSAKRVVFAAGEPGHQEIAVNVGSPFHYSIAPR